MYGSIHIHVTSKKCSYDFTLRRNITVLSDEGATGKSTLYRLLSSRAGVHISTSRNVELIPLTEFTWRAVLEYGKYKQQVFFTDESHLFVFTKEFADLFKQTGCYLVMITRDIPKTLPVSIHEIYTITSAHNISHFVSCYPNTVYGSVNLAAALTEDSASGFEFIKASGLFKNVVSAKGRDNILNVLKSIKPPVLIIADGAAFGHLMHRVLEYIEHNNSGLLIPESFEYVILVSKVFRLKAAEINSLIETIEAEKYFSWEQFFTDELIHRTQGTQLAYKKSKLNPAYLTDKNREYILESYGLSNSAKDSTNTTHYFK